jgi:hypothetical protein
VKAILERRGFGAKRFWSEEVLRAVLEGGVGRLAEASRPTRKISRVCRRFFVDSKSGWFFVFLKK